MFEVHIVTPAGEVYSGKTQYLSCNTPTGRIGLMHGAFPRVVVLSAGKAELKTEVLEQCAVLGDGLISIEENGVTIFTDSCVFEGAPPDK